jgi:subtilisin
LLRRTIVGFAATAALASAGLATTSSTVAAAPDPDVVPGSYIVTLKSGDPDAVSAEHGRRYGASVDHVYRSALRGYAAHFSEQAAARVARDDNVESVVADRVVRMTGKASSGTVVQSLPKGIDRIDGEMSSTISSDKSGAVDVDVAVIDTGSGPHGDLNVVGGVNCSSGTSYNDGNGHGTHVAGTIAAYDNEIGVVGVAPGARIWSVRVLNNAGSGTWSSIICGIDFVTTRGDIEVANMSLGGTGSDTGCDDNGMHEAICASVAAGVTYVVAAGNESDDAKNHVPAAYDEVITVSALADFDGQPGGLVRYTCRADVDDTLANFSNFGADVDIIAPGVCITSTWKGGGYNTISGTSMASPHVAGAAALYKAGSASASPGQVKSSLQTAGNLLWSDSDDPDGIKERLLNVDAF